jgi:hypothetical protein
MATDGAWMGTDVLIPPQRGYSSQSWAIDAPGIITGVDMSDMKSRGWPMI